MHFPDSTLMNGKGTLKGWDLLLFNNFRHLGVIFKNYADKIDPWWHRID